MFSHILSTIWHKKYDFFGVFFLVVLITYGTLYVVDFIPERVTKDTSTLPTNIIPETPTLPTDTAPRALIIDSLDKTISINNPTSTDVANLDASLLTGVARYPGTANMVDKTTMFLFGHSSYLAYVQNKNYQAFNGIQNLEWGDLIRVQSRDYENIYRVERVYEEKASTASVSLTSNAQTLTLVTCNTFGSKDDRYIVEAVLIDSHPIQ